MRVGKLKFEARTPSSQESESQPGMTLNPSTSHTALILQLKLYRQTDRKIQETSFSSGPFTPWMITITITMTVITKYDCNNKVT